MSKIASVMEEDRRWAKSDEAKTILRSVIAMSSNSPSASPLNSCAGIAQYLQEQKGIDANRASPVALRTISSLLSFPLTLGFALQFMHGMSENDSIKEQELGKRVTNVLVLGARAESSLPSPWWKELLYCLPSSQSQSHKLRVSFIGPDVAVNVNATSKSFSTTTGKNHKVSMELQRVLTTDKTPLHEHPECMKLLLENDIFVMFNPGFGSKHLKDKWDPTIRLLLMTRKPIIVTAHCDHDLSRDLDRLKTISSEEDDQHLGETLEFIISPRRNPFSSMKPTIDMKEETDAQVVYANHSIYAFCSK